VFQSVLNIMARSVAIFDAPGAAEPQAVLQVAQGQASAPDTAMADRIKKEATSKDSQLSLRNWKSASPIVAISLLASRTALAYCVD